MNEENEVAKEEETQTIETEQNKVDLTTQEPEAAVEQDQEDDELEIEVMEDAKAQESSLNKAFATARIERKKQKALEEELEKLKKGEINKSIKVEAEIPPQPIINDFLSDENLAKFDYDQNKAMAAFNQAMVEWQMKAIDAKSVAAAKQADLIAQTLQQADGLKQKLRTHYDVAQRLSVKNFNEIEDRVVNSLPEGWANDIIDLFPDKSAAIFVHLDKNPQKAAAFKSMRPNQAIIELTRLADSLSLKSKKKTSSAPPPDEPLSGGGAASSGLMKKMEDAANKGDVETYRKLKNQLRGN